MAGPWSVPSELTMGPRLIGADQSENCWPPDGGAQTSSAPAGGAGASASATRRRHVYPAAPAILQNRVPRWPPSCGPAFEMPRTSPCAALRAGNTVIGMRLFIGVLLRLLPSLAARGRSPPAAVTGA